jgi:flagellar biosynthesis protein
MEERKLASAIGYSAGDVGPRLFASGKGRTAERIIAIARESEVAVIEDTALAVLLDSAADPGEIIPSWCWEAVAKILAFVRKYET